MHTHECLNSGVGSSFVAVAVCFWSLSMHILSEVLVYCGRISFCACSGRALESVMERGGVYLFRVIEENFGNSL